MFLEHLKLREGGLKIHFGHCICQC